LKFDASATGYTAGSNVKRKVLDENNTPIQLLIISIVGMNLVVLTDFVGNYSLFNVSEGARILFFNFWVMIQIR
jgi:hypothetical protein